MNNECKRWTRQDKLSEINLATLEHYYSILPKTQKRNGKFKTVWSPTESPPRWKREWLSEFALIVKVIESLSRLEGVHVDYDRISIAEDS